MKMTMTKEQRAALLDRVDVLNKVKALMLLPGLCMITVNQAAEYFEETVGNIQKCYANHKDELNSNGVVSITPSGIKDQLIGKKVQLVGSKDGQLICIDDEYFEMPNRGCKFFPPRALLNLAMLLPKSRVAREVRYQLLNVVEKATPETRVEDIDNEQEMIVDIGKAFASGNIAAFAEAAQKYTGYLNRNLTAAQENAAKLEIEKVALNAANALLAENALIWEPRATLNALIRAIAAAAFDHKYSLAWDKFYRELKYRTGIHIASRAESKSGRLVLDGVREDEWPRLLKVAASLCYDYCVDVVYATNEETVAKYRLDIIETEFGVRRNRGTVTKKVTESVRKGA